MWNTSCFPAWWALRHVKGRRLEQRRCCGNGSAGPPPLRAAAAPVALRRRRSPRRRYRHHGAAVVAGRCTVRAAASVACAPSCCRRARRVADVAPGAAARQHSALRSILPMVHPGSDRALRDTPTWMPSKRRDRRHRHRAQRRRPGPSAAARNKRARRARAGGGKSRRKGHRGGRAQSPLSAPRVRRYKKPSTAARRPSRPPSRRGQSARERRAWRVCLPGGQEVH